VSKEIVKMKKVFVTGVVFGVLLNSFAFCTYKGGKVVMRALEFPCGYMEDGCWAGITAGSDGKIYLGLCTEGGGHAHFYIYDPDTDTIRHRADMAKFLGGAATGTRTQGKIHTIFCEDNDGNIYFATGNMGAGPIEVDPRSWEGGHWCRYEPKTDTLEDLGLVDYGVGIYGFAIDKKRMLLFGTGFNGHFYVHNIETGQTFDKGRVNIQGSGAARAVVADDEGNCYGTYVTDRMFKYDAKSGRVLDLSVRLPSDPTTYPVTGSIYHKLMRTGLWDEVNKKMYGVEGSTSILFEYDPKVGEEGQIRALERLMPYQHSEEAKKYHYATLSLTIGKDRKVYYMPFGTLGSNERNEGVDPIHWVGQGYLITYDLNTGKKEDLGPVFTDKGERVVDFLCRAPSGGATTGKDGTLYFIAWVEERDPKKVSFHYTNTPASLRLLIYKPK
jgi:hypothetical protein